MRTNTAPWQSGPYDLQDVPPPSVLGALHRACLANGVYLIAVLLLGDLALVLVRRHFGHMQNYHFIPWNLFLASVPYGVSLGTAFLYRFTGRHGWVLLPLYALWLVSLPNAPYLMTDFIHLEEKTPLQIWYDRTMLATYAVTGYVLAVVSLDLMHRPVRALLGWRLSWLFVIVSLYLAGVGVHLGRAQRYNSWDVVLHPKAVVMDALDRVFHPYNHVNTTFDALYYGAILLLGFVAYLTLRNRDARAIIIRGEAV